MKVFHNASALVLYSRASAFYVKDEVAVERVSSTHLRIRLRREGECNSVGKVFISDISELSNVLDRLGVEELVLDVTRLFEFVHGQAFRGVKQYKVRRGEILVESPDAWFRRLFVDSNSEKRILIVEWINRAIVRLVELDKASLVPVTNPQLDYETYVREIVYENIRQEYTRRKILNLLLMLYPTVVTYGISPATAILTVLDELRRGGVTLLSVIDREVDGILLTCVKFLASKKIAKPIILALRKLEKVLARKLVPELRLVDKGDRTLVEMCITRT